MLTNLNYLTNEFSGNEDIKWTATCCFDLVRQFFNIVACLLLPRQQTEKNVPIVLLISAYTQLGFSRV